MYQPRSKKYQRAMGVEHQPQPSAGRAIKLEQPPPESSSPSPPSFEPPVMLEAQTSADTPPAPLCDTLETEGEMLQAIPEDDELKPCVEPAVSQQSTAPDDKEDCEAELPPLGHEEGLVTFEPTRTAPPSDPAVQRVEKFLFAPEQTRQQSQASDGPERAPEAAVPMPPKQTSVFACLPACARGQSAGSETELLLEISRPTRVQEEMILRPNEVLMQAQTQRCPQTC